MQYRRLFNQDILLTIVYQAVGMAAVIEIQAGVGDYQEYHHQHAIKANPYLHK
jgi:uncharacterized membrane protein YuzA (DUF378 family)